MIMQLLVKITQNHSWLNLSVGKTELIVVGRGKNLELITRVTLLSVEHICPQIVKIIQSFGVHHDSYELLGTQIP